MLFFCGRRTECLTGDEEKPFALNDAPNELITAASPAHFSICTAGVETGSSQSVKIKLLKNKQPSSDRPKPLEGTKRFFFYGLFFSLRSPISAFLSTMITYSLI